MLGRAAFLTPTVHLGCAALAFIVSWFIWRETGLPCTIQTALILLCNPDSALSGWIRLDAIQQCAIIAGISLAITGGNDGMFFLQERRARKQAEAYASQAQALVNQERMHTAQAETRADQERERADQAETRADQAETRVDQERERVDQVTKSTQKWLASLTDEQKDAIYTGPVTIGEFIWVRVDGKDTIGPRNDADWLLEFITTPRPE